MKETHEFLVPDYFRNFSCKMGACRAACCEGWPISITMENYFSLLGLDCRKELRSRLDCAMYRLDAPTEEEYARFSPRYDGNCPLRLDDGRCGLHAELGEDVLPDICRLYPRGIRMCMERTDGKTVYECSCAGSCEAVLELLLHRTEPLTFRYERLTFRMPHLPKRTSYFETLGREWEIRHLFLCVVQDRTLPLPKRLMKLGEVIRRMDEALRGHDGQGVEELLHGGGVRVPSGREGEVSAARLRHGLELAERMVGLLDERSDSIRERGEEALAYFGSGDGALERYRKAKGLLETHVPNWETFFEHMLVNHMFFAQFPFQDRPENLENEFVALCAVYILLRFLTVGWMAVRWEESAAWADADLVDVCASVFRLIDHTEFDRYASRLLRGLGCADAEGLYELMCL